MRIAAVAAVASVAVATVGLAAPPTRRTPEDRIGLARGGPMEVLPPPSVKENDSVPGDRPVRPRPFAGAAPAIPHGIADFLPITRDQNACVDCHAVSTKKKGEPTPIPASHYVDQRNAPGKRAEKVVGARWSCTACHVPQQDVSPLVKAPFPR